ncbi:MAG: hypothetical protein ACJA13_000166 [Paraglaciecola sp.]|jgi:hypothetical protein
MDNYPHNPGFKGSPEKHNDFFNTISCWLENPSQPALLNPLFFIDPSLFHLANFARAFYAPGILFPDWG